MMIIDDTSVKCSIYFSCSKVFQSVTGINYNRVGNICYIAPTLFAINLQTRAWVSVEVG